MNLKAPFNLLPSRGLDTYLLALGFALLLGLVWVLFFFTWSQPIYVGHGFRQTQTALSAYWLREGYGLFNYITPVAGYPWAIPFELPWYQWIVAEVSTVSGLELDLAGRLVAMVFSLGTLGLGAWIMRALGVKSFGVLSFALLYLGCPQYLFWGRTFMPETAALFFTMAFLGSALGFLKSAGVTRVLWLASLLLTGTLAGTQKITTFFPVWLAVCVLFGYAAYRIWREHAREGGKTLITLGIVLLIPLVLTELWTHYADTVKALNPVGKYLTSTALGEWNFGTVEQRLSSRLWYDTIVKRVLDVGSIGAWMSLAVVILIPFVLRGARLWLALAALALFLLPFLIFTNLHIVHNYYQTANVIFLLAAVAVLIDETYTRWRVPGWALLAAVLVSSAIQFQAYYLRIQIDPGRSGQRILDIAAAVRDRVDQSDSIFVFGFDWSSEIAYYSQRKAMSFPGWDYFTMPQTSSEYLLLLGPTRLGGVVFCPIRKVSIKEFLTPALAELIESFESVPIRNCLVYTRQRGG